MFTKEKKVLKQLQENKWERFEILNEELTNHNTSKIDNFYFNSIILVLIQISRIFTTS